MRVFLAITVLSFATLASAAAQQQQQQRPKQNVPQATQQPVIPAQLGPTPGPGPDTLPAPSNPYGGDRTAMGEGRRLFGWYNCSGCHGDHAGGGMGPSLRDSVWLYGGTEARIYKSITEGRRNGMPSWGKLPPDQIWKLVAYIKSLRTSNEPDKP
jgi:cytochrome c oxidase cbb3-type subunit 3